MEWEFWFSLQINLKILYISERIRRNIIIYVLRFSSKVPYILVRFQPNLNFLHRFNEIIQYQISWISTQWQSSCSMRRAWQKARQTNRQQEANSSFCKFVYASKITCGPHTSVIVTMWPTNEKTIEPLSYRAQKREFFPMALIKC
jgi:hypothetical protein